MFARYEILVQLIFSAQSNCYSKSAKLICSHICVSHFADGLLRYCRPVGTCHYQRVRIHESKTEARVESKSSCILEPARIFAENLCNYSSSSRRRTYCGRILWQEKQRVSRRKGNRSASDIFNSSFR